MRNDIRVLRTGRELSRQQLADAMDVSRQTMSTTARSARVQPFLLTVLLGPVMAAILFVVAGPELGWLGFAMAGICRSSLGRRCR